MMKIVLVGYGKAGYMHELCYSKLPMYSPKIEWIVEPKYNRRIFCKEKPVPKERWLASVEEFLDINMKDRFEDFTYDICTPPGLHYENIQTCINLGARFIIVEKPLCINPYDAQAIVNNHPNIFVAENYLYSSVTEKILKILKNWQLEPELLLTFFSKNRVKDSHNKRGVNSTEEEHPHVFSIEIPHQIAISLYILGPILNIIEAKSMPMKVKNSYIDKHGTGLVRAQHSYGVTSIHYSSLTQSMERKLVIKCQDGTIIVGDYATNSKLIARIMVFKGDKVLKQQIFVDDSLTQTLLSGIKYIEAIKTCEINDANKFYTSIKNNNMIAFETVKIMANAIQLDSENYGKFDLKTNYLFNHFLRDNAINERGIITWISSDIKNARHHILKN